MKSSDVIRRCTWSFFLAVDRDSFLAKCHKDILFSALSPLNPFFSSLAPISVILTDFSYYQIEEYGSTSLRSPSPYLSLFLMKKEWYPRGYQEDCWGGIVPTELAYTAQPQCILTPTPCHHPGKSRAHPQSGAGRIVPLILRLRRAIIGTTFRLGSYGSQSTTTERCKRRSLPNLSIVNPIKVV